MSNPAGSVMVSRHIVVGCARLPDGGAVDLVLLPGQPQPEPRDGLRIFKPESLEKALFMLRMAYSDHKDIATLASTAVIGEPEDWREAIEERLATIIADLGNCPVDSWAGALNVLRNAALIETAPTSIDLLNAGLNGQPAICLGAGPSAHRYLAEIHSLRKSFRIFCADSMLVACVDAGIDPDYVTFMERIPEIARYADAAPACTATMIAPPIVAPEIPSLFGNRVIWWYGGEEICSWIAPTIAPMTSGRSAGTLAVAAAVAAGCNPIYLIGHDLSYADDGSSHAPTAHPRAASDQTKEDAARLMRHHFPVPGNSGRPVQTNDNWNAFRVDIETLIADGHVTVVNVCDNSGAMIAGAPVGSLPATLPTLDRVRKISAHGTVIKISDQIPSIRADCERIRDLSARVDEWPVTEASERLAISKMVSPENIPFFRYCFRSIYHGLLLRMHIGGDHQETVCLLALTLGAMAERMLKDMACHDS